MTDDASQELLGLESTAPSDRARAAGWLLQHPLAITSRALMQALQAENVPQIRRVLLQVLDYRKKLAGRSSTGNPESHPAASEHVHQNPGAPSHVDIAALIRHELSPAVGWIRLAADSEIESFALSKTNEAVRKLQRRIDGLVAIIKSGEELNLRRVSLPHVLTDNWPDAHSAPAIQPAADAASIDIETDEGLFAVLLSNVFQNAIDASTDASGRTNVMITWGYTDQAYWVRVANPFKGDRFTLSDVIDIGSSSKMAHQGQGLSLVQAVADRLELAITLEGASGMASFTLSGGRPSD